MVRLQREASVSSVGVQGDREVPYCEHIELYLVSEGLSELWRMGQEEGTRWRERPAAYQERSPVSLWGVWAFVWLHVILLDSGK